MNVILLAPMPPPTGGIAGWTARMMNADLKNGWQIRVVDEKVIGKRGVFGEQNKRNYYIEICRCFKIWHELSRELRNKDSKIVHSCIPSLPLAMIREYICAIITMLKGRKFIIHFRCTVPNTTKGRLAVSILRLLCNKADLIICLNRQSEEYLTNITQTPIKIIPNFIEGKELTESHAIRERIEKIVYVGGVVEDKGVIDIIKVAERFPEITFKVIGEGDKSIVEIAKKNQIKNVIFTGSKDRSEVKKELQDADLFLFLTYFYGEGFSNALCEAMASGLPCVVTDWAANKDMIGSDGGLVINVKDVDGAVKALEKMNDPNMRSKMSAANIKKVKETYLSTIVIDQYVDAYESLL